MKKNLRVTQLRQEGREGAEMQSRYEEKISEEDFDYPKDYAEWAELVNYRRRELGLAELPLLNNEDNEKK